MTDFLPILAILIGAWYARKYGREAITKINKHNAEKKTTKTDNT